MFHRNCCICGYPSDRKCRRVFECLFTVAVTKTVARHNVMFPDSELLMSAVAFRVLTPCLCEVGTDGLEERSALIYLGTCCLHLLYLL
jgi:hypothetical protein